MRLTAREEAMLAAVERRLSNAEIAAEFSISVRTVESHIAALRRKLGVDTRTGMVAVARSRRGAAVRVPRNSFVGRDADLRAVRERLLRQRWVTVVGPAGCGKTRLALELAAADDRTPVVTELEQAAPGDVVGLVAQAVGLGAVGGDPVAACGLALGAGPTLLVLDNCDRVTGAVRPLVAALLAAAPDLAVLATSRSPAGGSDEAVYPLAPLPVEGAAVQLFRDRVGAADTDRAAAAHTDPAAAADADAHRAADADADADRAGAADADRAAAADTDPAADADRAAAADADRAAAADAALAARICRRLDGLPLAIELAAARARHLPLAELADRLDDGFGPLEGTAGRHRTLESAFDWTWDLLDDADRAVLGRLAALPGSLDLALAEAVAGADAGPAVLRLADRSLLAPATGPGRFRLLAALRAVVLDRTDPAVAAEVRAAHARYHADRVGALAARARTDDSRAAADASAQLLPEANAALDWAVADGSALPLARAMATLAEQYGPRPDTLDALARAARDPRLRAAATGEDLSVLGQALLYGDVDLAAELADLAVAADPDDLAGLQIAGTVAAYRTGPAAVDQLAAVRRLAERRGDRWQLAAAQQSTGTALRRTDPSRALAAFTAAMHTYAEAGDAMHVNNSRYMMAVTAADLGLRTAETLGWAQECVSYALGSGNRHELGHALFARAALSADADIDADLAEAMLIFRAVGDLRCLTRGHLRDAGRRPPAERAPFLREALEVARRAHDRGHQTLALERLVAAQWAAGAHRDAAVALGTLTALLGEAAVERAPAELRAELPRWQTALAEGRARG